MTSARSFLHCILVLTAVVSLTTAFSFQQQKQHTSSSSPARRAFISNAIVATVGISSSVIINPLVANAAGTGALIEDLKMSKDKIAPIPSLLEAGEWDKVRTILKTPPVNALWNLGVSDSMRVRSWRAAGDWMTNNDGSGGILWTHQIKSDHGLFLTKNCDIFSIYHRKVKILWYSWQRRLVNSSYWN